MGNHSTVARRLGRLFKWCTMGQPQYKVRSEAKRFQTIVQWGNHRTVVEDGEPIVRAASKIQKSGVQKFRQSQLHNQKACLLTISCNLLIGVIGYCLPHLNHQVVVCKLVAPVYIWWLLPTKSHWVQSLPVSWLSQFTWWLPPLLARFNCQIIAFELAAPV